MTNLVLLNWLRHTLLKRMRKNGATGTTRSTVNHCQLTEHLTMAVTNILSQTAQYNFQDQR
jgi:hypothetical protein